MHSYYVKGSDIMANEVNHNVIHKWAAVSAVTAGTLPVGVDATTLFAEEVLMVVNIASLFGYSISKETAKQALLTDVLGNIAGTMIFESLNVAYYYSC